MSTIKGKCCPRVEIALPKPEKLDFNISNPNRRGPYYLITTSKFVHNGIPPKHAGGDAKQAIKFAWTLTVKIT